MPPFYYWICQLALLHFCCDLSDKKKLLPKNLPIPLYINWTRCVSCARPALWDSRGAAGAGKLSLQAGTTLGSSSLGRHNSSQVCPWLLGLLVFWINQSENVQQCKQGTIQSKSIRLLKCSEICICLHFFFPDAALWFQIIMRWPDFNWTNLYRSVDRLKYLLILAERRKPKSFA